MVGLRESSPRRRKGSSNVGRGGGFCFLFGEEEDALSAVVLELDGNNLVGRVGMNDGWRRTTAAGAFNVSGVIVVNAEHTIPLV